MLSFGSKPTYICGMEQLLQQIEAYKQEIGATRPDGADAQEAYRIRFLGTKGIVKSLFTEMKNVPVDKKKDFGQVLYEVKQLAVGKYEEWKELTAGALTAEGPSFDLSLPGDPIPHGTHHPITLERDQIVQIFGRL